MVSLMARIDTEPKRNILDECGKCTHLAEYQAGGDIVALRKQCARKCPSQGGILKGDAVSTAFENQLKVKELQDEIADLQYKNALLALELEEKPKFAPYRGGKGSTYFKRYSETIANLRAEGKTQKQISEILGISVASVNKICKKL